MSALTNNRGALLGALAIRNELLTQEALAAATVEWQRDDTRPLGQVLLERGLLSQKELAALEALVEGQLERQAERPAPARTGSCATPGEGEPEAAQDPPRAESTSAGDMLETRAPTAQETAAAEEFVPPTADRAPRYRALRSHARGGLGEVFVALDEELQREVALKEILPCHAHDAESRARFLLEAEVTGRLEHPGVVPVYGLGQSGDGRPFYAMRFIKGVSLLHAIEHFHADRALKADPGKRALELRQLLGRFQAVCNTIAYAHSKGILHRDLKPDNIMLGPYGETLVVDWGLAKALDPPASVRAEEAPAAHGSVRLRLALADPDLALTQAGDVLGTVPYMSPEQAWGRPEDLCPASDTYSLGATLYHLLTGRPPFTDRNLQTVLEQVRRGEFPPPSRVAPAVPAALEAICLKAMARTPRDRYATAEALADDVEHWLADEPVSAWKEPLRPRLARWRRRHPAWVTGAAALAATALVALGVGSLLLSREQGRTLKEQKEKLAEQDRRALAQVTALLDASPQAVPNILDSLKPHREQIHARLLLVFRQPEPASPSAADRRRWQQYRTRAALALLPEDRRQCTFLQNRLLDEDVEPPEMLLIRGCLLPYKDAVVPWLWTEVDQRGNEGRRFRALVALAGLDPTNPRWAAAGKEVVGPLLAADPLHVAVWSAGLRGVRDALLGPLGAAFRDPKLPSGGRLAAGVLKDYAADRPEELADLLMDAAPRHYPVLLPALRAHGDKAVRLLQKELKRHPGPDWTGTRHDALGRRQANAAVTLLLWGRPEGVWPLLRMSAHPDARTHLLHRCGWLGVDARLLWDRLRVEKDASARQALILALGEYTAEQIPVALRGEWTPRLLEWYRDDPDPGIHAGIDWLLCHGNAFRRAGRLVSAPVAAAGRRWTVNGQGQTMVVFPGPVQFLMGSPESEAGRRADEVLHRRRIGRSFAIASKDVTVAQFQRFLKAHPEVKHRFTREYSPDDDGPIISVTWYEAAQYCRWLSEQEGVKEDQMCYPSVAEIEKCKEGKPLKMPANYLTRTGYRLPTDAEWEYGCRGGSQSARAYGSSAAMLEYYAWYIRNSDNHAWPVGQKKPNAFGLFDMHGNTWNWCQSAWAVTPQPGETTADEEDTRDIEDHVQRVLRGGSFTYNPKYVRSAYRLNDRPSLRYHTVGLRVARTYRR